MNRPLIFDAHLDLALNAIEWNRDLTRSLEEVRRDEAHLGDKPGRARGTYACRKCGAVGLGFAWSRSWPGWNATLTVRFLDGGQRLRRGR